MSAVYQDILYWGVHLLVVFKALGAWIYTSFFLPACLGTVNLGISVLVYQSIRFERKQRSIFESELSASPQGSRTISFPYSFTFVSVLTGLFNFGGAFFRSQNIRLIEIPTTWITKGAVDGMDPTMLANLIEAERIVAVNDWGSLFLSIAFFVSGCFNFATVRQLRLRDIEAKKKLLPLTVEKNHEGGFGGHMGGRIFVLEEKEQLLRQDCRLGRS